MALSQRCRFHYADEGFDLGTTAVGGYLSTQCWTGNSIYDPDVTGVGVQPYGYDGLVNQYQFPYFTVHASAITLKLYATEAFRNVVITLVPVRIYPPSYTDLNDLKAIPGAKQVYASSDSKGVYTLKHYWTTKTAVPTATVSQITGQYNSNPSQLWFWALYVDTSIIATEIDMYADVQIEYYTSLYKGTDQNES